MEKTTQTINHFLSQANRAFQSRDFAKAMRLTEQALSESPHNPYALGFQLGLQLSVRNVSQADATLARLLSSQCEMDDPQLFINNTQTLLRFSRFKQALAMATAGVAVHPDNPNLTALVVQAAIEARDLSTANSMASKLARQSDKTLQSRLSMANLALMSGDFEEATLHYMAVLTTEPENSYALAGLSKTRRFEPSDSNLIAQYKDAIKANTAPINKARIGLGLAKLYNDLGEYGQAWETAETANAHKRQTTRFDRQQFTDQVDKVISCFTPHAVQAQQSKNLTEHVFVVGMPRSGTTLIEQILSVIPEFYAGGETPAIDYSLTFGRYGNDYLHALVKHQDLDLESIGVAYEDYFQQFANYSGKRIVNKVPTNFFHIGLIKLIFPRAKIINMQRAPLDLAVSIYFENFSEYFAYTNSVDDIFHVYDHYQRMMTHWCELFGNDILTVNYQDVVENYQQEVNQIGQFIHADMPEVERIRKSVNHVETPSVWQVRQPINTNAVNRWQRYQRFLKPYIKSYQ